jgi:parallel beta-helix repeat protein
MSRGTPAPVSEKSRCESQCNHKGSIHAMATIIADRTRERSNSTGTGDMVLTGAPIGFRPFSASCIVGDGFYGTIVAVDGSGIPTGQWETGFYTYSAVNTLTRNVVTSSSSNGAKINFAAGEKDIFIGLTAEQVKNFNQTVAPPGSGGGSPDSGGSPVSGSPDSGGNTGGGGGSDGDGSGAFINVTYKSVPTVSSDNITVTLDRDTVYVGTLNISGRTNVQVVAATGTGAKPVISPGALVTGWTQHSGNIYRANFSDFAPYQVSVNGLACQPAHFPSRATRFLVSDDAGTDSTHLRYTRDGGFPNGDLVGATACVNVNRSVQDEYIVTAFDGGTLTLRCNRPDGCNFDGTNNRFFYVEGKLWMMAATNDANVWAYENGVLYVWCDDGQSPANKQVWATREADCIDARGTNNCGVDSITLLGGHTGIYSETGNRTFNLSVNNCNLRNHANNAMRFGNSTGTMINACTVINAYRDGLNGWFGTHRVKVKNCDIRNTGIVGMSKHMHGHIFIGSESNRFEPTPSPGVYLNEVVNNTCLYSSYHGIQVTRNFNCLVKDNIAGFSCIGQTDGGCIYTGSPFSEPQNMLIEGNIVYGGVRSFDPNGSFGIYLDDHARDVVVKGNQVYNFDKNIYLHNAKECVVINNRVETDARGGADRTYALVQFNAHSASDMFSNVIFNNTFITRNGSTYTYNFEAATNQGNWAHINFNFYESVQGTGSPLFFRTWDGGSFAADFNFDQWKSHLGSFSTIDYWDGTVANGARRLARLDGAGHDAGSTLGAVTTDKTQYSDQ